MPKLTLHIPTPCTQNWNSFPQNESGGFCSQCSKTVIDFTQLSDKELYQALALQNPGKICGRFTQSQLNRDILITNNQSLKLNKILAGLLIIGSTQTGLANALHVQSHAHATKTPIEIIAENGREAPKKSPKLATDSSKFIVGKIVDEQMNPIAYATVTLKNNKGVFTNNNGQFKLIVPDTHKRKITIQVSAVGYEHQEISFSIKQLPVKSNLTLKMVHEFMGEVVIVRSDD